MIQIIFKPGIVSGAQKITKKFSPFIPKEEFAFLIKFVISLYRTEYNYIMTNKIILQKLSVRSEDSYVIAERYYSILSALNNLHLTQREVQLVAFTAVRGNMSYANVKDEFCKKYNSSSPTISNIVSKLKKIGIFVKEGGKIKVNPMIALNFNMDVQLEIKLLHG